MFLTFESARPVKYGVSYFWFDFRDSFGKARSSMSPTKETTLRRAERALETTGLHVGLHAKLLNSVKVLDFEFRV